ncbi:MAG: hypothetical protein ACF8LK_04735 [Phycisphaerales bacterium JB041]
MTMTMAQSKVGEGWTPHGPLSEDEQLYFLHIPKTAGTSLRTFLESRFDVGKVCPHLTMPAMLPTPPSELAGFRLFCGHHGLYLNRLLRRDPVTVTVLRDPLARTVSHYRHLQATQEDWLHERVKNKTFEEFVCGEWGPVELLNFQTRYLAFDDIQEDYFGHSRLRVSDMPGLIRKYSDPSLADKAKRRLDSLAVVGVQERFNEMLTLLSATFGWSPASTFHKYNTAKSRFDESAVTPAALARVQELTEIDREVYEHACGLFEAQFAAMTPERSEELYRDAMRARPRLSSVQYGFDKAVQGENWLAIERPGGKFARWTGPGTTTTLDLPLATDKPLRLRCFVGAQTHDVVESTRVFANDVELDLRWWQMHDPAKAQRTIEATIPPEVLQKNDAYCRLRFEVSRAVVPSEEWPGRPDNRRLALYFFWLDIESR